MRKGWPCQEARDLSEVMGIIHGWCSSHHPEVHLLLSARLWTAFPHYQCCVLLSLVPVIPPPPQGESWYCLSLKSLVLRTTESLLMTLSSVWIKKSPGRGDVLVPAPFRSSGVMQQERRCRQFGSCTGNKLECLFKHSWWKGLRFWGAKWCSVVKFYSVESKMWVLREAKEHISQNCRGQMCSLCGKYSHEHTSSAWLSWDGWSRLKPEYESSSVQCEFVCL